METATRGKDQDVHQERERERETHGHKGQERQTYKADIQKQEEGSFVQDGDAHI